MTDRTMTDRRGAVAATTHTEAADGSARLSVGILETGRPPEALVARHGGYDAMVRRMLGDAYRYRTYRIAAGDWPREPEDHDAYVITGSAAGVYDPLPWIEPLQRFIRTAQGRARMVGLCFGHQVMAAALGGRVEKSPRGWGLGLHRYALTDAASAWVLGAADHVEVAAMHQDQVMAPPPGAAVLAASAFTPFAALRYGRHAVSVQFHPEFEADFAQALVERRRDALEPGEADRAIESLAGGNRDAGRVAGWIRAVIDGQGI